ncbi:MAG: hypothetical protein HY912_01580 [Desulfomonile tiedjei]|uniref:Uncharacterized protein n=1 Tax=Desulfomonile tiedjei TaxID=2358 RepID=A0A9D6Z1X0_9BACT|nr:hypothetical protein [Desulfomonile tiedjei]
MNKQHLLSIVAMMCVASLALGVMPTFAAQDASDQPGVASPRQSAPDPVSEPSPSVVQHQGMGVDFWKHARDPFAAPGASKLCASGLMQACALVTPSD